MFYSVQNIQHVEQGLEGGWCSLSISVMHALISSSGKVGTVILLASLGKMRLGEAGTSPGSHSRPPVWCLSQPPDFQPGSAQAPVQPTRQ